jgi:hypothetical protein
VKTTKRRRTTEITIETEEVFVAHGRDSSILWWCDACGQQAPMVPPDEAARIGGLPLDCIAGLVDARKVHQCETGPSGRLICLVSLTRQL